jgi:hypothetical protein
MVCVLLHCYLHGAIQDCFYSILIFELFTICGQFTKHVFTHIEQTPALDYILCTYVHPMYVAKKELTSTAL